MSESLTASFIMFTGANGEQVQGYLVIPEGSDPRGSVIVLHHMPGFDRGSKEIARRFATMGYNVLCPNLYWREAPEAAPDDAAAVARANGGVPDERLIGDAAGAAAYLRRLSTSNGKVGVIGYCSGGRQSVLVGCTVDVDAVVDCYGAFVTGTPSERFPLKVTNLVDQLPDLRAPLLGLFGADDQYPSPEQVAELEEILVREGKTHTLVTYEDTGHAFFTTDRSAYRFESANDGWSRITDFYATYLGA
ncbi:MAG: dienelactone hydrolase family protein [Actinomycetota bacterium]|nr:dienelactone hydrolase family protein [Actinomycetota bacterium]MDP2287641.1 dienelactone hydrolase family protein [Actinomycetota bacterium]